MLKKIIDNINFEKPIENFIVCGDSGCDGYNTEGVIVFEEILNKKSDFTVIAGDLVPVGTANNYEYFKEIVDTQSASDVFCICGNHDIKLYDEFLGKKDYYVNDENTILIFLDNSKRYFSQETMEFLDNALEENRGKEIFLFFHIPPKNPLVANNIIEEEWNKIKSSLDKYKDKVIAIFCGHIHSYADYNLDGYRVIITGGAGSKFDIIEHSKYNNENYHYYVLKKVNGFWIIEKIDVHYQNAKMEYKTKGELDTLMNLEKAYLGEAAAHRKYLLYAEISEKEGYHGTAKLFRATAESEYFHAKNMLAAMNGIDTTKINLESAIENERFESEEMYVRFMKSAKENKMNRAYNAFLAAHEAEKVHYRLLKEAYEKIKSGEDISIEQYYTCNRCGYTHKGENPPRYCPGCGTDMFKFSIVK